MKITQIVSIVIRCYDKTVEIFRKIIDILFVKYYHITTKVIIIAILIMILQLFSYLNNDVFYYADKDTSQTFTERHKVEQVGTESVIQATLRKYLAGSNNYKGRIPFTPEVNVLNISHDEKNNVLILNWNSYFYKALEKKNIEQDIAMLLQTIGKNYKIDTVYFLVEGASLNNVFWNDYDLGVGLPLKDIMVSSHNITNNKK